MHRSVCWIIGTLAAIVASVVFITHAGAIRSGEASATRDAATQPAAQPTQVSWDAPIDPVSDQRTESSLAVASRNNVDVQTVCRNASRVQALAKPQGQTVKVTTTEELKKAIEACPDAVTILLADGVYRLDTVLLQNRNGITIRGQSGDREKVVLDGDGLGKPKVRHICIAIHGCHDFTIADLTIRNYQYGVYIYGDGDVRRPVIRNLVLHNIWVRGVKGTHAQRVWDRWDKAHLLTPEQADKVRPREGRIEYCLFHNDHPKTDVNDDANGDYISGIDMMWLKDWTIVDNVFVNIRGHNGRGRGAIFVWNRSEDVVAERNVIVNCDRGIAFGNPSGDYPHMTRGIARNNFITAGAGQAIEFHQTAHSIACNNTIYGQDLQYRRTIEFQTGNTDARFYNNLVHGSIYMQKDGVDLRNNIIGDLSGWFVDPAIGNLHLTAKGTLRQQEGLPLPEVTEDFDRQARGRLPGIGADEVIGEARK